MPKTDIQKLIEKTVTNGLGYSNKRDRIERDNPDLNMDRYPPYHISSYLGCMDDRCKVGYEREPKESPQFRYVADRIGEGYAGLLKNTFDDEVTGDKTVGDVLIEHISEKMGYKSKKFDQ